MSATALIPSAGEDTNTDRSASAVRVEPGSRRVPVYVLSLARATERRQSIAAHLDRRGIAYEIIDGVDGRALPDSYVADIALPEAKLSRGMIGCNLSHAAAYRRLLESSHDIALVLEDDARLAADAGALLAGSIDHARFDFCLLDCLNRNYRGPVFYDPDDRLALGGGYAAYRLSSPPLTLHAYLISRTGAEKRLNHFFPMREPIDTYAHAMAPLRFFRVVGKQAAWVCEYSLDSMTSTGGRMQSYSTLRSLWRLYWFRELVDWVKLTRLRHLLLARLMKAEFFVDPARRWKPLPTGRPLLTDE